MHKILNAHLKQKSLANGYFLTGNFDILEFANFLEKYGDVHFSSEEIGINEVREIKEAAQLRVGSARPSFFLLNAEKINRFVPQSLLKTIEDSLPGRHFFIASVRPDAIPYTLRSRLVELFFPKSKKFSTNDVSSFVYSDYQRKVKKIEQIAGDKEKFIAFLDAAEYWAIDEQKHDLIPKIKDSKESALVFNIGRKMCLEYVAHLLK